MRFASRALGSTLAIGAVLTAFSTLAAAPRFEPGVVIVKLKPGAAATAARAKGTMATGMTTFDQLSAQYGVVSIGRTVPAAAALAPAADPNRLADFFTLRLADGADVLATVAAFASDPNVLLAEPNYVMPIYAAPNDPMYSQQWTHYQSSDYDIDSDSAWILETGDSTILIGIIDSGVKFDHPDLIANVWVNPGEDLDGDGVVWDPDDVDGVDSDGDGHIDDFIGWDFLESQGGCDPSKDDCFTPDNNPSDIAGHGTHVSGIVAATTDNAVGVAGVAGGMHTKHLPGVKIMCLRAGFLGSDGNGYVQMDACASAFNYGVAHGASVFNCSWGSSGSLIWTAVENAIVSGAVVCAAAGNDNTSSIGAILDTAYGVMVVASVNKYDNKSGFSNYGSWVDICAPGEDIANTFSNLGAAVYANLSGTSMASPTVAGVAALIKSHKPSMTGLQIDTMLLNSADTTVYLHNPGFLGVLGRGRVNAYKPLTLLSTADFTADTTFGRVPLTVQFTDASPNAPSGPYLYLFGDGGSAATASASHTYLTPGLNTVQFTATGPTGPHTRIRPEMIVVVQDTVQYLPVNLEYLGSVAVPVRLRNTHAMKDITLPFLLSGTPTIYIDSVTTGARTPGWNVQIGYDNRFFGEIAARLTPGALPQLPAGNGIIAYLWIRSSFPNSVGQTKTVDSADFNSTYWLRLKSSWADFRPDFVPGVVTIVSPPCSCPDQGDVQNNDHLIDVFDVIQEIAIAFSGGSDTSDPACPTSRGDVKNADHLVDVFDVIKMIEIAFSGGTADDPCAL